MLYRPLGRSGIQVSVYGLGTNAFGARADEKTSIYIVHHALDRGVNLIDTADRYNNGESERIIGVALKDRRHKAVLATKFGMPVGDDVNQKGSSRHHIMRQVEASLRRLQTDYIDLYQVHTFDPNTPLEETLRALDDLVSQGKVRYIGCSNYAAWQLAKALWVSDKRDYIRFSSAQHPYSLLDRRIEQEVLPLCRDQGVGILAYYPLAGGLLTGKYTDKDAPPPSSRADVNPSYREQISEQGLAMTKAVADLARQAGVPLAQFSLHWAINRPGITSVLVGATSVEQQERNLESVTLAVEGGVLEQATALTSSCVTSPALAAPWFPVGLPGN